MEVIWIGSEYYFNTEPFIKNTEGIKDYLSLSYFHNLHSSAPKLYRPNFDCDAHIYTVAFPRSPNSILQSFRITRL